MAANGDVVIQLSLQANGRVLLVSMALAMFAGYGFSDSMVP